MKTADEKRSVVQVDCESEKLEAIRYYLSYKGTSVEKELSDALDAVYRKCVPVQVREYIERKNAPQPSVTESTPNN